MNFTTIQILAFVGAVAAMAIVFGLGYLEGRRAARQDLEHLATANRQLVENLRHRAERAQHEHTISRLNAAQALEHLTEELDATRAQLASLQQRVMSEDDANQLIAMAEKLSLAANTFAGLGSTDQAQVCRRLSTHARALFDRYWQTLPTIDPLQPTHRALSTWERVDAEHTGAATPQCM